MSDVMTTTPPCHALPYSAPTPFISPCFRGSAERSNGEGVALAHFHVYIELFEDEETIERISTVSILFRNLDASTHRYTTCLPIVKLLQQLAEYGVAQFVG